MAVKVQERGTTKREDLYNTDKMFKDDDMPQAQAPDDQDEQNDPNKFTWFTQGELKLIRLVQRIRHKEFFDKKIKKVEWFENEQIKPKFDQIRMLVSELRQEMRMNMANDMNTDGFVLKRLVKSLDAFDTAYEVVEKVTDEVKKHWADKADIPGESFDNKPDLFAMVKKSASLKLNEPEKVQYDKLEKLPLMGN